MSAPVLRALEPVERAQSVTEAAAGGDRRALLVATGDRVARALDDPKTPPAALAALARRMLEIYKEIDAVDASGADDVVTAAAATPDEVWDESAI